MKRYVYINDDDLSLNLYCNNRISNRKYTLLNFLPKNLREQFSRFINQYFLLIACLQLWPLIAPVDPATTWGPLIIIFSVSAMKEAWDDYNRYLLDKKANEREVWVVRHGIKTRIHAQEIRVGNIVWLHENDEVPCDLVLIGTSEPQGVCYVETASLDGETDLKSRSIPSVCIGLAPELLPKLKGLIECPNPDKDIRRFDANLRLFPPFTDNEVYPLTTDNALLQSCYLRNTEWACGVAIYTGNETKLGMSRCIPEPKLTAADSMIDKLTEAMFVFQIIVVIFIGIAGNVWEHTEARKHWYLKYSNGGPWFGLLVIPLRFELLCSIIIPISIKVYLDLTKTLHAKFIDWDMDMYDSETGTPPHATNTAISEDLGQVDYILTDKTGTLTENRMIFRRCCIKGIFYGNQSGDALKDVDLLSAIANNSPDVVRFLTVMAICNTVTPVKSKSGAISYKAQSQDEDALVTAATHLQMVLVNKNGNIIEVSFKTSIIRYELLDTLEFTSDRKRMSVVVKDCLNGNIILLSKGADEAILPLAYSGQQTRIFVEAVEKYDKLGLRTLCFAWRDLKEDEYREWSLMFREASSALFNRESRLAEVCQRLEHELEVLGVTAIEDRLQGGVPETIETLRKAGINIWMLTGDKQNTAIQIALSCNLISPETRGQVLIIDGRTEDEVSISLERVLLTMRINSTSEPKDVTFVVDGWTLEIVLNHYLEDFTKLAMLSGTAICCRVTPSQKAQLVEILKTCNYRTLAIGDGGNDVRMIQQAHIGVGISGREGLQAARAADYSIGKFRFLKRLILVHGRYSYNRTAFLSQYSFYKSPMICFIQILFSLISGVSGTSLFNSVSLMAYNVFYTSVPALVCVLDKDLSESTVMQHPQIYSYSKAGRLLNPRTYARWFARSLFHAIIVFVVTIHVYAYEKSEMEEPSMVALSGCLWLQTFLVILETSSFTMLQHLAIWGNLAVFYIINFVISAVPSFGMYTIMFRLCKQPYYWITIFLIVAAGTGPVLAVKYFCHTYRPNDINILQQAERMDASKLPILSHRNVDPQLRSMEEDLSQLSVRKPNHRNSLHEALISESTIVTTTLESGT